MMGGCSVYCAVLQFWCVFMCMCILVLGLCCVLQANDPIQPCWRMTFMCVLVLFCFVPVQIQKEGCAIMNQSDFFFFSININKTLILYILIITLDHI